MITSIQDTLGRQPNAWAYALKLALYLEAAWKKDRVAAKAAKTIKNRVPTDPRAHFQVSSTSEIITVRVFSNWAAWWSTLRALDKERLRTESGTVVIHVQFPATAGGERKGKE